MTRPSPRGHFSKSRSLADFNKRFSKNAIEGIIGKRLLLGGHVRVLEVGCGEGRVLMELAKIYPGIELHGINKVPWPAMKGTASLRRTAIYYKIFKERELKSLRLPKIHFYDACNLKFKDNHFDLIYSQVAIPYFIRKDRFLEEAWRVLKPGGTALLHLDSVREDYPDFMQFDTPRFIIYDGERVIPIEKTVLKKGLDIKVVHREMASKGKMAAMRTTMIMKKNTAKPLKLGLELDELATFEYRILQKNSIKVSKEIFWGCRSVFKTR